MMLATVLVIPLIIVVRKLPVEVASLVLIMLVDEDTPLTVEVRVLVAETRELVVDTTGIVIVVVATTPLTVVVNTLVEVE